MPETKAELADEVEELRDRIKALEEDLKKERHDKRKDKGEVTGSLEKLTDEMNRLTRGLFFAGMEAIAVSANMTRTFVDKVDARSTPERRDTMTKTLTDLPVDASKGFLDALECGMDDSEKVIDKFYAKYKEKTVREKAAKEKAQ
jgi:hypothetical protein